MNKISVVIIAFNEAEKIERCIASTLDIADEIIVVDSFSTDDTKIISERIGATVIQNKFEGHIEQKNFAVRCAKFDFILSLDADECLSPELSKSIIEIKNNLDYDAFNMNRLNNFCGKWIKHGDWYPDRKIRLWKKSMGSWGGENPHDHVVLVDGTKIKHLTGDILHYTISSLPEFKNQTNKFTDIASLVLYRKNIRSNNLVLPLKTIFTFVRAYIIRAGFLDGYYGFIISKEAARYTYLKYYKLSLRYKQSCCD
jgi:glycosyltransferase involved in cell wall biosynthesis